MTDLKFAFFNNPKTSEFRIVKLQQFDKEKFQVTTWKPDFHEDLGTFEIGYDAMCIYDRTVVAIGLSEPDFFLIIER